MGSRKSKSSGASRESLGVDAVADIECAGWTEFVRGAVWTPATGVRIYADADAFVDAVLAVRGCVWCHAGGSYDSLFLLDAARRRGLGARIVLSGPRVLSAHIGHTVLRDSFALIPLALARAAPMFGAVKAETGLPCECGQNCGGYCAIRRDLPRAKMARLESYLAQDVEATRAVVTGVLEWLRDHGAEPRPTIGATAWRWAKRYSRLPDADRGWYYLARRAYYGGRTEVYRVSADRIWRYDIHSSYPAALSRTALPVGEPVVWTDGASKPYRDGAEGIYHARVRVPDMLVPPLPVRTTERLLFPTGTVEGWWTGPELRAAEAAGVQIERVMFALAYPRAEAVLAPWCRMVWGLRTADKQRAPWIKLIANSLTGKLAQRAETRAVRMLAAGEAPRNDEESIGPLELGILARTVTRVPSCAHVEWAAYLTAVARVELGAQLRHAAENAVYCDTDSVYATRPLERRVGDDLGEWGFEGEGRSWVALAPKLYSYISTDGTAHTRAKGFPGATRNDLLALAKGAKITHNRGVRKFLSAARAGSLWTRSTLSRQLHLEQGRIGGRVLADDGVRTLPPAADEYLDKASV